MKIPALFKVASPKSPHCYTRQHTIEIILLNVPETIASRAEENSYSFP